MSQYDKRPSFLWIGLAVIVIAVLGLTLIKKTNQEPEQYLKAASSFQDAHGMGINPTDASKLYIATHQGLLLLQNDSDLFKVGSLNADFMGFAVDQTQPDTFYSSGHNAGMTGNLGLIRSSDAGRTWDKVSNGIGGPVDFHAMTVGAADSSLILGTSGGKLQRS